MVRLKLYNPAALSSIGSARGLTKCRRISEIARISPELARISRKTGKLSTNKTKKKVVDKPAVDKRRQT